MFKIKGEKKNYFLKVGSELQIYDAFNRVWVNYVVCTIKFSKSEEKLEVQYFGKPQFSRQLEEVYLCRESNISEHIEQNLLRIVKR